jgi:hypothetical protein
MCGILEEPGETKERWPYLRAALSSIIEYTANIPHNQPIRYMIRFNHFDDHKRVLVT